MTKLEKLTALVAKNQIRGAQKMSDVFMPAELTAENGAKNALTGEFFEEIELQCIECLHSYDESENCAVCGGEGTYMHKVPVSWTTIKAIYKKAVKVVSHD